MDDDDARVAVWRQNLLDELDGMALYQGLVAAERDPARRAVFARLAEGERRHAALWEHKLRGAGAAVPGPRVSARTRALLWLARHLGTGAVLPLVIEGESIDAAKYASQRGDAIAVAADEEEHQAALEGLRGRAPAGPSARITRRERWHRAGRDGSLRAAVFGMNDGLVSNVSLVLGVAAAGITRETVLLTGMAGLFAGALSMAVGEYVSMASQRDVLRHQIRLEARELAEAPAEETAELADLLAAKGLPEAQARALAAEMMKNPDTALDTLVREELGLDPANLGSPLGAAVSSFATFATGATLPLLPFVWIAGTAAMVTSAIATGVVLTTVGATLGFLSGTNPLRAAGRMLGLGALATAVTVLIGRLVGAAVG